MIINNILYLDDAKMYSMSSQIFEGITEYFLRETGSEKKEDEQQKGPVASGKVLANAMKVSEKSVEKRFLHDHSLSLFETRLFELGMVDEYNSSTLAKDMNFPGKSFIKITAKASFIDAKKIISMLGSFNEIGEALSHITAYQKIENVRAELSELEKSSTGNKLTIQELRKNLKFLSDTSNLAKFSGLYQDPKFLKNLAMLTDFGFSDQFEIQQKIDGKLFSSALKRQYLRESEDMIMRKYSRRTEKEIVILGHVTQMQAKIISQDQDEAPEEMTMKEAVTNLVNHIAAMENSLAGKAPDEIVIDPIAVYVTL